MTNTCSLPARLKGALPGIIVLLGGLTAIHAQQTTGTLLGTVTDSSAATVIGAKAELRSTASGFKVVASSDSSGHYVFNAVLPGSYQLTVSNPGFKSAKSDTFAIEIGRNTSIDIRLEPGQVSESITVSAATIAVDTISPSVSTSVDAKLIQDMPNVNRFALAGVGLAPGVTLQTSGPGGQVTGFEGTYAKANGNRSGQNSWYLDGGENAGAWRNSSMQFPNPDALQEFNIQTSNSSAEYGKQPGAVVNAVIKSGTNDFHGTGFFFTHNQNWNANNFNSNAARAPRLVDNQRNWGGVLGGPVRRNRTFFFGSYNRYTSSSPGSQLRRLPTQAMLNGDFSEVPDFNSNGRLIPFDIKDPATGASLGKRIPASMINPVAKNLSFIFPTAASYFGQVLRNYVSPTVNDEVLAKGDHRFNDKHQISAYYLSNFGISSSPSGSGNTLDAYGTYDSRFRNHTGSIRHFWLLGPTRTIESRVSILDGHNPRTRSVNGVKDLSDFGAKLPFTYPVKPFPGMSISGLGAGVAGNTDSIDQSNYRLNVKMSWVIGRHNIRFGGETQRDRNPIYANGSNSNQYNFSGMFSLNGPRQNGVQYPSPGNFGSQSIGYSFADFLLGQVENFALTQVWNNTVSYHTHNLFVQDEWKVRPRLSLSLGLRYELYGDAHEDNDMLGGIFYRGHQSDLYPKAPFGLGFVGDKGVPRGLIPQDKNNFSPRLGVAYDLTGKGTTVIRAGIGIYYSAPSLGVLRQNAGGAWKVDLTGGNASLSDPVGTARFFPWDQSFRYGPQNPPRDPAGTYSPNDYPWLNNLATVPVNGVTRQIYNSSIIGFDQGLVTPYSLQWNIALERQVAEGIVVSAGYVGNRAVRLTDWQQINPAAWRDGANTSAQSIRDRRLDTNYSSLNSFQSRMRSSFDSLQLTAHFRRVHGFTSEMNYVFAKQITPWSDRNGDVIFNTAGGVAYPNRIDLDKAENLNHHAFKWFGTYDLPFAKGSRSFLGRAIGGWVLAGAWQVRSGSPLNVTWGYDANADNEGADRPSLVAPIRYTSGSKDQLSLRYLDASSFGSPCGSPAVVNSNCNVLGNLGRNAIWGVGAWSIDTSLIKSFRVSERTSAQFRWEASNLTNSNFLGAPSLGLGQGTNPDFGRIFQRSHSPRTMQLGLKFSF